ncbi:hypothetical protein [Gudongella oleilytica]|uniref:hypothetical protein n=1 Tax=Gudongella oleilytica TaxID=1582259 RepID=UPI002A36477E|nr:hypothetical protein [Gudongella oleilytica]MDY0256019.1 hypothetical protein [Gudongella oleilytica]
MSLFIFRIYQSMAFLVGIFIFGWILFFPINLISMIKSKIKGEEIDWRNNTSINPFMCYKSIVFENHSKKMVIILNLIAIIGFSGLLLEFGKKYDVIGNTQIGSNLEKNSYTEEYYVILSEFVPFAETPGYKCEALIEKDGEYYMIINALHPNGYTLDFDWDSVEPDEWNLCDDQIGVTWDVKLTTERVE